MTILVPAASHENSNQNQQFANSIETYLTYSDSCFSRIGKGTKPNQSMDMSNTLVADTGNCSDFVSKYANLPKEQITFKINEIYQDTIANGVVDHHVIDSFLSKKGISTNKCSAKIVYDYPSNILEYISKNAVTKVDTHMGGDLDSYLSSYLIKHLMQYKTLPSAAQELTDLANKVDYGNFRVSADEYVSSIAGIFSVVNLQLDNNARSELGKQVFSNPEYKTPEGRLNEEGVKKLNEISKKHETQKLKILFKVFDLCSLYKNKEQGKSIDVVKDAADIIKYLDEQTQELIENGKKSFMESYKNFEQEFEQGNKLTIKLNDKNGNVQNLDVLVANSKDPLFFTNNAYTRVNPNTIVAVYAGSNRVGGDMYDIGIISEKAQDIDLGGLCVLSNQAEAKKRNNVVQGTQDDLQNMGISEEKKQEYLVARNDPKNERSASLHGHQIVVKCDPTVLVAGNSLIAASRTSLLTQQDFEKIFKELQIQ